MATETQTYKVETVYETVDKSSRQMNEIEKSASRAAASTHSLKNIVMGLGAVNIAQTAFGGAKKYLLDFNSSIEQSKTVIAGMLSLYTGANIERTWQRASISVERFQDMARKSSLTTKELVETAQGLTRPLIQVGVKMTDIEKITFGVANAAKAFGMNGAVVAMDVEQALRGSVTERDRFMKSMLAQQGVNLSADQFNKKNQAERIKIIQKALTSEAISAMADKQSQTMQGQMSTLEDNLQIALGKVGMPLFKAITAEVKGWNDWIEKNADKIESVGRSFAKYIMTAFSTIKEIGVAVFPIVKEVVSAVGSVMQFALQHKDTLVGLIKAMLVFKIGQTVGKMGAGAIGDVMGFGGGLMGNFKQVGAGISGLKNGTGALGTAFGNLGTVISGAGGVLGGLGKLALAAYALGGFLFGKTEKEKQQEATKAARVLKAKEYAEARKTIEQAEEEFKKSGIYDLVNRGYEITEPMTKAQWEKRNELKSSIGMTEAQMIADGVAAGLVRKTYDAKEGRVRYDLMRNLDYGVYASEGGKELGEQLDRIFKDRARQFASDVGTAFEGGQYGMPNQVAYSAFFVESLAKKIGKEDIDNLGGSQNKPPTQNVTINIQQLTAKDPNRWLAEMDDMVNRRVRAPTRAKRQWKNSTR